MTIERRPAKPVRKSAGAVQCWASPAGGWSYIQTEGDRSVTIVDPSAGGTPVERAIPSDRIAARMTPAEIRAARKAGRIHDTTDGTGFTLDTA